MSGAIITPRTLPSPVPGGVDLVVAVAGPTDKELALEAKTPFWNLLLIDPKGGRWRPSKIARIEDRSPDRRFFPFHDNWSRLYLDQLQPPFEVAVVGPKASALRDSLQREYIPNAIWMGSEKDSELDLLKGKYRDGKTLIFVCQNLSLIHISEPTRPY